MYQIDRLPAASLAQRWGANLLDLALIGGPVGLLAYRLGGRYAHPVALKLIHLTGLTGHNHEIMQATLGLMAATVFALIRVLFMCRTGRRRGQSLGHQLVGSKIVRYDDQPISKFTAFWNGMIVGALLGAVAAVPFGGVGEDYLQYKSWRQDRSTSLDEVMSGTRTLSVRGRNH